MKTPVGSTGFSLEVSPASEGDTPAPTQAVTESAKTTVDPPSEGKGDGTEEVSSQVEERSEDVEEKFTPILQKFNLYLIDSVCRYLLNFGLPENDDKLNDTINKIYGMIITSVFVESFFDSLQENKINSDNVSFKEIYTRSNRGQKMDRGDSQKMFESLQSQENIFGKNYYPKGTITSYILDKIKEEREAGLINLTGGSISSRDFE